MNTILALGVISLTAFVMAKLLNKLKLPSVTGYLVAGLILGPCGLVALLSHGSIKIITPENITSLSFISDLALGLIAFHIGESFEVKQIKKLGKSILTITFLQAFITVIVVFVVILLATMKFTDMGSKEVPFSLVIAAISAATAPAATLMVIKEYHAKGPLTDTLISVVAMDDLVCIILFSLATAVADALLSGSISLANAILSPLIEIFGSFAVGAIGGFIINLTVKKDSDSERNILIPMSVVLLCVGISIKLNLSSLLTCCTIGAIVANFSPISDKIFDEAEHLSTHIYVLFFTISGMSLDISLLAKLGIVGVIYILARAAGKISGGYIGSVVTKAEPNIRNYLGLGLLPQAGVAIGLATLAAKSFPATMGGEIQTLIMSAVFVYELIGPVLTKFILIKAGEAKEKH